MPDPSPPTARPPWLRVAAFVLLVVLMVVVADRLELRAALDPVALRADDAAPSPTLVALLGLLWLAMMGSSGPAIAAGTVLFGWVGGTIVSMVGAFVAHTTWFWLARHSLRTLVQARASDRVRWLVGVIDRGGPGLVIAWNVLGGPGSLFLFAASLSRLRYRIFALGVASMLPRVILTALGVDTLLLWDLSEIPRERWLLLAGVGLPLTLAYAALVLLRPELRPWRFGRPELT